MPDSDELDAMADRLAGLLDTAPENISTYPLNGHIGLTVEQLRKLLRDDPPTGQSPARRVRSYYDDRHFLVHELETQGQRGDWIALKLLSDYDAAVYGATGPGITNIPT